LHELYNNINEIGERARGEGSEAKRGGQYLLQAEELLNAIIKYS
jgi:hypothetical protein